MTSDQHADIGNAFLRLLRGLLYADEHLLARMRSAEGNYIFVVELNSKDAAQIVKFESPLDRVFASVEVVQESRVAG